MTIPDQPSALSKEELAGLLGRDLKQSNGAQLPDTALSGAKPGEPESSRQDPAAAAVDPASARAQARSAADGGDDIRMVLDHWERTVAGLQLELIELRSRVARLEQQLGEETARPVPPHASGPTSHAGRAVTSPKPAPDAPRAEEEPSALSRVRTYRSKRGWF
ncbi:hypothetical protein ACFSR7_18640 [Cohnella sp. GCM10020058]|uniref:hypothetical protein n=1 Tax=Cohnella sp. GCM10020058 TaxID=3317330 RepID=UPI003626C11F